MISIFMFVYYCVRCVSIRLLKLKSTKRKWASDSPKSMGAVTQNSMRALSCKSDFSKIQQLNSFWDIFKFQKDSSIFQKNTVSLSNKRCYNLLLSFLNNKPRQPHTFLFTVLAWMQPHSWIQPHPLKTQIKPFQNDRVFIKTVSSLPGNDFNINRDV